MPEVMRFVLPTGRIVSGSPTYKQDKEYKTGKPLDKPRWFLAVAVRKDAPPVRQPEGNMMGVQDILGAIFGMASRGYANHQHVMTQIRLVLAGNFKWKIEDGDSPGNVKKEGQAGCWIFNLQTTLGVPTCVDQQNRPCDPALIKCGYFVDVAISTSINELTDQNAGVYMNPDLVRFVAYGEEIRSGPNPDQAFGGHAGGYLPPGASPTPLSPGAMPNAANAGGFGGGGNPGHNQGAGGPQGFHNPPPGQQQSNAGGFAGNAGGQMGNQTLGGGATGAYPSDPNAHVGVQGAGGFGQAQQGAPSGAAGFAQGTASPSNVGNLYPGAQQHHGFGA